MEGRSRLFKFLAHQDTPHALYDVEEWEAAVHFDPASVPLRMTLCRVLARRGRLSDALAHCHECLALQPIEGPLAISRRLRVVAMSVRLRRAALKVGRMKDEG